MRTRKDIETAIAALTPAQLDRLRAWLDAFEAEQAGGGAGSDTDTESGSGELDRLFDQLLRGHGPE